MEYLIMRGDDPITIADFAEDGTMLKYSQRMLNETLAPLQEKSSPDWLKRWWRQRSIPMGQGKIAHMLQRKGLLGPEEFLIKNLGLSLTDYYWIKPVDSKLRWKNVNLFENDFKEDLLDMGADNGESWDSFTPNSSLQGQLEKTWIIRGGDRVLVKGNHDHLSSESINEVIASELHRLQGYDNYTAYELLKIKGKEYDYGCCSKAFTSLRRELLSAYGVVSSRKKKNDCSVYEQFIGICVSHGMDGEQLRADLEYQIMTDFILSNRDRHLGNISILRDADSLKFLRMAPIYDSGKSLFVHDSIPISEKELLNIRTNSFQSSELGLLKLVKDRSLVDVTRLPSGTYIRKMYELDSQMEPRRIDLIVEAYERKIEAFRAFQSGEDLAKKKFFVNRGK